MGYNSHNCEASVFIKTAITVGYISRRAAIVERQHVISHTAQNFRSKLFLVTWRGLRVSRGTEGTGLFLYLKNDVLYCIRKVIAKKLACFWFACKALNMCVYIYILYIYIWFWDVLGLLRYLRTSSVESARHQMRPWDLHQLVEALQIEFPPLWVVFSAIPPLEHLENQQAITRHNLTEGSCFGRFRVQILHISCPVPLGFLWK